MNMTMDGCGLAGTYVANEPDIEQVGVTAWQQWWNEQTRDVQFAWADAYRGQPVSRSGPGALFSASADYVAAHGFVPEHKIGAYGVAEIQQQEAIKNRNAMLLVGGGGLVLLWLFMRSKKRR